MSKTLCKKNTFIILILFMFIGLLLPINVKAEETVSGNTITFEGTYDTEEDANNKKDEVEQNYNDLGYQNIESNITTSETEVETGNIIEEYVDSTINTEEGAFTFDNEEDANNKKDELEASGDGHYVVITVTVNKQTVDSGEDETQTISKTFESEDAANAYLAELEADGYTIVSSTFTHDTTTQEGSITNQQFETEEAAETALENFKSEYPDATGEITYVASGTVDGDQPQKPERVTQSMILYKVGNTMYVIIKKGNEIIIWTEEELDAAGQAQFIESFADLNTDHPITGDDVAERGRFISGYNKEFKTSNGKKFHFEEAEDGVNLIMEHPANSQLIYGGYQADPVYILNASGTKEVNLDSGTLEANISKDIMVDEWSLDVTTEEKHYNEYPETETKTIYNLIVTAIIPEDPADEQSEDVTPITADEEADVVAQGVSLNPQTGDNILEYLYTLLISLFGLCLSIKYLRRI